MWKEIHCVMYTLIFSALLSSSALNNPIAEETYSKELEIQNIADQFLYNCTNTNKIIVIFKLFHSTDFLSNK